MNNQPSMLSANTYYDYFIFKGENSTFSEYLCDSTNTMVEAEELLKEDEYDSMEGFIVPKEHYFTGYYFYNDMSDYDEEDEYMEMNFISMEHAELYQDSNDSGGHHQWIKTEEWKDGELINTTIHSDADGNYL